MKKFNPLRPALRAPGMFHVFTILTTCLCLAAGVIEAAPRTCRLIYPERPKDAPKEGYLFDGKKSHRVTLPSMNLSEVIELPPGDITIALSAKEITDSGAVTAQTPQLKVAAAVTSFYLILLPGPENTEWSVKLMLADASDGKLKPGETVWHNCTDHRIMGKLGDKTLTVEPKGDTVGKPPQAASGYYKAEFSYQAKGEGAVLPITEQSWWHDGKSRYLGIIVDAGATLPKLNVFRDFRE